MNEASTERCFRGSARGGPAPPIPESRAAPGTGRERAGEFVIVCGHVTGVRAAEMRGSRGRTEGRAEPPRRAGSGGRGARR